MCDPTIQKFLKETTLDLPVAGKRPRIDLAGPSGVSPKKAGHNPGWTKPLPCDAADAGDGQGSAVGPEAVGPDVTPRAASRLSLSSASSSPVASARPAVPRSSLCACADVERGLGHGGGGCGRGRG